MSDPAGNFTPDFMTRSDQLIVSLFTAWPAELASLAREAADITMSGSVDLPQKAAIESWRQVEEDAFVAHLLKLRVGYFVAVLNRICTGINRGLYAGLVDRVDGNLEMLTMCFFNYRRKFRNGEILIRRNFDHIDVLKLVLPHCLSCTSVPSINKNSC